MNEIRVNDLLDRFFNGILAGEDRTSLEQTLLATPRARELFWRKADIHTDLRRWGISNWDRLPLIAGRTTRRGWRLPCLTPISCRVPVAVLLALAIGTSLGAGIAWAVSPQPLGGVPTIVDLANGGFEDPARAPVILPMSTTHAGGLPPFFGQWTADRVRVTGSEHAISPFEGRHMLAFEEALPGPGPVQETRANSCNLFQVIDLRPYSEQLACGDCLLTLSAQILDARENNAPPTKFFARITIFEGEPETVLVGWPEVRFNALASGGGSLASRGGRGDSWTQLGAKVMVPKDATFAVVQIDATNRDRSKNRTPAIFHRQYCDDVRLSLGSVTLPAARSR